MIKRNLSIPHRFICFTENSVGIDKSIQINPLPDLGLFGWWYKPYIFKKDLLPKGDINFFIDLDMVIIKNIDKLINFEPDKFLGLQDPSRAIKSGEPKLGSAVMRWISGQYSDIWEVLSNNKSLVSNYKGDQDYIWSMHKNKLNYYPREWILSYKWEVRNRSELTSERPRKFKTIRNPVVHNETCILAFHGYPRVDMVQDPIIVENWI